MIEPFKIKSPLTCLGTSRMSIMVDKGQQKINGLDTFIQQYYDNIYSHNCYLNYHDPYSMLGPIEQD